jgi:LmbE family N-acetylglucosaminyl deacetylase
MLALALPSGPLRLLCLGAHADDIEIGCGGTLLELLAARPGSTCLWVVFGAAAEREREARAGADLFLRDAGERCVTVHQFRDGYFPADFGRIKDVFEETKRAFVPDLIFTHAREDRHQDHSLISDVTWQTFRDHLVLEYDVPKYDGDLGQPNLFVPLPRETALRKAAHLLAAFPSQRAKHWFTEDAFLGPMRLRGVEAAASSGFAEAFTGRKLRLGS